MQILSDVTSVFEKQNIWVHLITALIVWLSPSLELLFLLYGITVIDWGLDVNQFFKDQSPKIALWANTTKPCVEKLLYYTTLAIAVFATEQHLFKNSIPLYTIMMGIPISAELLSIAKTVEENTGIKVVSRLQDLFNSFFRSKEKGE